MRRLALGFFLVVLLCAAAPALAQQGTSELGGRVTDAQGGVLPGANIVITNEDTGQFREMISSAEGTYFAQQMTPGRYRVAAKLEGFKTLDRRGITPIVGQTTTLDLQLEVGGLAETLTVSGEAPLVDVSTAEVGDIYRRPSSTISPRSIATTWRLSATFQGRYSFRAPSS